MRRPLPASNRRSPCPALHPCSIARCRFEAAVEAAGGVLYAMPRAILDELNLPGVSYAQASGHMGFGIFGARRVHSIFCLLPTPACREPACQGYSRL